MPLFTKHRHRSHDYSADRAAASYRFRLRSRQELLASYDRIAAGMQRQVEEENSDRARLARVLESMAAEGWRLVGIADGEFVFRSRG